MDSKQEQEQEQETVVKQPAPVLAWHREAIKVMFPDGISKSGQEKLAAIIAARDPHQETVRLLELAVNAAEGYQKGVRLLEEASGQYVNSTVFYQLAENIKLARTHLATLSKPAALAQAQKGTK